MEKTGSLVGKKFGMLTVIGDAGICEHRHKWYCACECGNETIVSSSNLKNGSTTSCGCKRYRLRNDLTGRRFGKLLVIEKANNICGKSAWRCLCDCGAYVNVRSTSLVSGKTKSCGGCLQRAENSPYFTIRRVYEDLYGDIPDGYSVTPLDGDYNNQSIENLILVSRGARKALLNDGIRMHDFDEYPDIKKVAILSKELSVACKKIERDTKD